MDRHLSKFNNVLESLSQQIRSILNLISDKVKMDIQEIRLRNGSPLNIYYAGNDAFITASGGITNRADKAYIVSEEDIYNSFQLITNHSIYAYAEDIKRGYITISGGHRVGIGGKVIYDAKGIDDIVFISSLNIRIAKEKEGVSNSIIPYLLDKDEKIYNTLIISPPQCGKTTLLRDIIRNLSNGIDFKYEGQKISLIDERSEIAGVYNRAAQMDVGIRTDILDGCLKSDGIMMAIRALSPEIIAVDEIGSIDDINAINEALKAGIRLIATIHGDGMEDIENRNNLKGLIEDRIFKRFIILDRSKGVGTIRQILEGNNFKDIYYEKRSLDGYY